MRTWVPLGRRAACRASSGPETPAVQNVPSRSRAEQPPTPQASAALGSADMGRLGSSHVRGVANTGQPARARRAPPCSQTPLGAVRAACTPIAAEQRPWRSAS